MARFRVRASACLLLLAIVSSSVSGAQPPSASASPVTTRELVEIVGISGLTISPDDRHAVIRLDQQSVADNRTKLEWTIVDLKDGRLIPLAPGGEPRWEVNGGLAIEQPQWSKDGSWVYFRRLVGEELQLWRAAKDGSRLQQVTHDAADVSAFVVDEDAVHYAVGPGTRDQIKAAEQMEYDEGVLLDSDFIVGYRPTHNFPFNGRFATIRRSATAENFGRATLLGETPLSVKTLFPDFGGTTAAREEVRKQFDVLWKESDGGDSPFDPQGEQKRQSVAQVWAEISSIVSAPVAPDSVRPRSGQILRWVDAAGKVVPCRAVVCADADFISVVGWTKYERLIFRTKTFGITALNWWDIKTDTVHTLLETEGVLGSSASGLMGECQITGEQAVCISATADQPPRLISVDLQTGRTHTLFNPNPALTPERLGVASRIMITDRDGSSTFGRVILPRHRDPNKRLPLVITSYTCNGFLLGGSGQDVPEHVLAGLGFAAVCVDSSGGGVRRAPGFHFTVERSQLSGLDFFEGAVDALDKQGLVDPGRVLVTGFSGSAYNTTFAISHSRMFTAAAVTTGGSADVMICYLASHYRSCADMAKAQAQALPYDSRSGIFASSPAWNADKIVTPLLMQLPEPEYAEMMQLFSSLLDYGRAVEMHIFADAYHHKSQPRQRLSVYNRNIDWANFWLRGVRSMDPSREDQNTRWSEMRDAQCRLLAGGAVLSNPPWYCVDSTGHNLE